MRVFRCRRRSGTNNSHGVVEEPTRTEEGNLAVRRVRSKGPLRGPRRLPPASPRSRLPAWWRTTSRGLPFGRSEESHAVRTSMPAIASPDFGRMLAPATPAAKAASPNLPPSIIVLCRNLRASASSFIASALSRLNSAVAFSSSNSTRLSLDPILALADRCQQRKVTPMFVGDRLYKTSRVLTRATSESGGLYCIGEASLR